MKFNSLVWLSGMNVFECGSCGALVNDPNLHEDWHELPMGTSTPKVGLLEALDSASSECPNCGTQRPKREDGTCPACEPSVPDASLRDSGNEGTTQRCGNRCTVLGLNVTCVRMKGHEGLHQEGSMNWPDGRELHHPPTDDASARDTSAERKWRNYGPGSIRPHPGPVRRTDWQGIHNDEGAELLRELLREATDDSTGPYEDFTLEWQQDHYARVKAWAAEDTNYQPTTSNSQSGSSAASAE